MTPKALRDAANTPWKDWPVSLRELGVIRTAQDVLYGDTSKCRCHEAWEARLAGLFVMCGYCERLLGVTSGI